MQQTVLRHSGEILYLIANLLAWNLFMKSEDVRKYLATSVDDYKNISLTKWPTFQFPCQLDALFQEKERYYE